MTPEDIMALDTGYNKRHSIAESRTSEGYSSESLSDSEATPGAASVESPTQDGKVHAEKARPLCLDYLNGTCGRMRAHCKYYHPKPGEVVPEHHSNDVCEVWALSGFCKFGSKCRKQHPPGIGSPLHEPVAEPFTRKFQEWLQSQGVPRNPPAGPTEPESLSRFKALLRMLDRYAEVAPQLLRLVQPSGALDPRTAVSAIHNAAITGPFPSFLYADLFALLRLQVSHTSDYHNMDGDLSFLMIATGRHILVNPMDQRSCVRNVRLLAELFRRGVALPPTVDVVLHSLLTEVPPSAHARSFRANVVSELLAGVGPEYLVKPTDSRRLRVLQLGLSSPRPHTTDSPRPPLWATLINPQPAFPATDVCVGAPLAPPIAPGPYSHQPYAQ